MLIVAGVLSLLALTLANRLEIVSPPKLQDEFNHDSVLFTIAKFGHVAYGRSMRGEVLFQRQNEDGCGDFLPIDKTQSQINFILVKRGGCTFVHKARNVQNAGAKMAIVYDNQPREDITSFIMVDDGTGKDIEIPLIMISETDGDILRAFLSARHSEQKVLQVRFANDMGRPKAKLGLYFSADDAFIYPFLAKLKPYYEKLKDIVEFQPHFHIYPCTHCSDEYKSAHCFTEGKYCSYSTDYSGQQVLLEDLRQMCILQNYQHNQWWDYVENTHSCSILHTDCLTAKAEEVGIDNNLVARCVSASFEQQKIDKYSKNWRLERERRNWENYPSHISPSVTINDVIFRGEFDAYKVFTEICGSFRETPEECKKEEQKASSTFTKVLWISLLIVFLVIANVVIIYCYRRLSKREMHERLHHEVNSAVSAYFALSEGTEKE